MNDGTKHMTLRVPTVTKEQVGDLAQRWGENKSQVVIRSIDRTWVTEHLAESNTFAPQEQISDTSTYYSGKNIDLYLGDAKDILPVLGSESVDSIVTSPPYYGQRDYGVDSQIGLESHPNLYINRLLLVFKQCWRILKPTGSLWVNIGDTYWSGKGRPHGTDKKGKYRRFTRPQDKTGVDSWCVPKQRLLIPHRFAIAMQDDGWIVRNDNVWYKSNPVPDPVGDRCSIAHEYVFHFVKQKRYWFNTKAVAIPSNGNNKTKPPRSVWEIQTSSSKKNHAAVFPEELISLPIKATCPPNGVLLDPFCGSGTSLSYSVSLGDDRRAIGIDVSEQALKEAKSLILLER